jgi:8-oxo-dGTP pyrophosphatase MutT (NUDIX family)
MTSPTAFDTIESAQEFLALLREAVEEAKLTAASDTTQTEGRNLDALRIVLYKLEKLEQHLKVSGRLLNDLRTLRRLLLEERDALPSQNQELTGRVA